MKWKAGQYVRYYLGGTIACGLVMFGIALSGVGKARTEPPTLLVAASVIFGGIALAIFSFFAVPEGERRSRAWEPVIVLLLGAGASAILVPVFMSAAVASTRTSCLSNVKQLTESLQIYAADHDDHLPLSASWRSASEDYRRDHGAIKCPQSKSTASYAFNRALSGLEQAKINDLTNTIVVFECDSKDLNFSGAKESLLPRHAEYGSICFADGTARMVRTSNTEIRWKP